MPLFFIAACFVFTNASTPIPRQALSDTARSTDYIYQNAKADEPVPTLSAVQNKIAPISYQDKSDDITDENKPNHVVVDKLPGKDRWDKFYICLTAALVIIAGFTLAAIWYQAVQSRRAVEVAEKTIILQFRPKIVILRRFVPLEDTDYEYED